MNEKFGKFFEYDNYDFQDIRIIDENKVKSYNEVDNYKFDLA